MLTPKQLDSAFQLQEHLAALHYHHTAAGTTALTRSTALQLAQPPPGIDRTLWLYELCRFLISQCNSLIVGFLFDTPPCSAITCPEMRASEWQFLCAVHEQPKSCCAIDYCCHTLDWAANVVTDQKLFPSRFAILHDAHSKNVGIKNLVNVFRRLHRIFAHAWFQHRSVFWAVEGQTGLYVFFKTVCDLYDLLPAENYKLPPEAEGLEAPSTEAEAEKPPPVILKASSQQQDSGNEEDSISSVGRTNTRRHIRSSPSTGSSVTTVIEADEEENDAVAQHMKDMHISSTETAEEESEEVPVMVEHSVMEQALPPVAARSGAEHFEPGNDEVGDQSLPAGHSNEDPSEVEPATAIQSEVSSPFEDIQTNAGSGETSKEEPEMDAKVAESEPAEAPGTNPPSDDKEED